MEKPKNLLVYDFDWSLIDDDSDHFLTRTLINQGEQRMKEMFQQGIQWTDLMDTLFGYAHLQGVTKEEIIGQISLLPLSQDMIRALLHAKTKGNADIFILSDANTFFIDELLKAKGIRHLISDIITNQGDFDSAGRLRIRRRLEEPHGCKLGTCAVNICKGKELVKLINESSTAYSFDIIRAFICTISDSRYARIVYVGDGKNDFCPCTKLGKEDIAMVRKHKSLESIVKDGRVDSDGYLVYENGGSIKAKIQFWDDAKDIASTFEALWL